MGSICCKFSQGKDSDNGVHRVGSGIYPETVAGSAGHRLARDEAPERHSGSCKIAFAFLIAYMNFGLRAINSCAVAFRKDTQSSNIVYAQILFWMRISWWSADGKRLTDASGM